jgi:3-oxoacyl-[acyl-carrier protein] reductase
MGTLSHLLELSGQVALVTGASRGIGLAIARLLGQAGARLGLVARHAGPLGEAAAELEGLLGPDRVLALPADVAREEQVNEAVAKLAAQWGRVDILVNNAGLISLGGPVWKVEPAEWERVMGANLTGAYLCCRAVIPYLQQQQAGRIINIASISAQTGGVSGGAHYSSSKGGMISLTKTLSRDLAPFGVTVNAIAPGQIDADPKLLTPEQREKVMAMIPLGRLGLPEDVACAVLFLASPMAAYITGATIDVNGGILKR